MKEIKKMNESDYKFSLDDNFKEALENEDFNKLCTKIKAPKDVLKKHTTKIMDTVEELDHCKKCKGLYECQNKLCGYVYYPKYMNDSLDFFYVPCKYQKKSVEDEKNRMTSQKELENARMKDIDITDRNRIHVIKWLKKFYDDYDKNKSLKGLYLHGSFGCGKTFLTAALFNELNLSKKVTTEIVYFPEALRELKDDWSLFNSKVNYYETVDLLLIDDIGAEKVTEWGRDEVLGTILQSRMNNKLPTFFTSNYNINELEKHLALANNNNDYVKSRRIIERIKQLTEDLEMISENKRK